MFSPQSRENKEGRGSMKGGKLIGGVGEMEGMKERKKKN